MRIDKANQRFLDYQNAKVGDVNGRELLVQITNNGVVEDQTGTTLKLNWQHENGNQGYTNFNVVDAKTGKYSLYYPKEMLYKGTVDASVEINSNGQITNTMNFKIIVHADVFNGEAGMVDGVFISLADVNKKLDDREKEYVELKNRQNNVENQFNVIQQEITDKDVISSPEIIAARNGEATLNDRLDKEQQEVKAQLAQNLYKANYLSNKIKNKDVVDVYIVGDSISAGVGSSGYNLTTTPIFTDKTGVTYYEPNHTSPSWANRLRSYLERVSPNSALFNGAIGGKSAKFFNENKALYMPDNKDVVFVMLGTNDRVVSANLSEFKTNLTELLEYVDNKSNFMVVMSANPVKADYDAQGNFSQEEANSIIVEICKENDYFLINHFTETTSKMYAKNYNIEDILTDNAHPNDRGYALYWDTIQKALGINDTLEYYNSISEKPIIMAKYGVYTKDTAPKDFPKGSIIYSLVVGGAGAAGYPENKGGTLITDTTSGNLSYYYQYYHIVNENKIYKRATLSNQLWGTFEPLSKFDLQANNYITNASMPLTDFPMGKVTVNTVTTTDGLPLNRTGVIEVIAPNPTSKGFVHEKFYPSNNNYTFGRALNPTLTEWLSWKQDTRNQPMQQFTKVVDTIPAGGTTDVDLEIAGGLNNNFMHLATVESALPAGIVWSGFKKSNTEYTLRFQNTNDVSTSVGAIVLRYVTLEVIAY